MMELKAFKYGLMKPFMDAHTLGINSAVSLLMDCGCSVVVADLKVAKALDCIENESSQKIILDWIIENGITHLGISYRLDPEVAIRIMNKLVYILKRDMHLSYSGGCIRMIFFAGLPNACEKIRIQYNGFVKTLQGGELAEESLLEMGVPSHLIPASISTGCQYDKELFAFGKSIIEKGEYEHFKAINKYTYSEFGTRNDSITARLNNNYKQSKLPLIRAHLGPYSSELTREENLKVFLDWCEKLSKEGYLDILSIGTSQLSQSNFGENWDGKLNGGGVPVNSEKEYDDIWQASRPLLLRTYSGTKDVKAMAELYERSINICWHALSLWWFNKIDGRGPNQLYDNLCEHIETIRYIALTKKPLEANVSHHFSFRGSDDVTYVVSAYLSAKLAKKCGIRTFVLQNMLNTPRSTWGVQDLAKSRAMLSLVKTLESRDFTVIFQTRAGLDYFKPNNEIAKIQLATVTALMDDIDPYNCFSPEIIHVVSYSEALHLATPEILNESIKITQHTLEKYREQKKQGNVPGTWKNEDVKKRTIELLDAAQKVIKAMEANIPDLYSAEGLYLAFVAGWLPVPDLWDNTNEFMMSKAWKTKLKEGAVKIIDEENEIVSVDSFINRNIVNLTEAQYILKSKYKTLDII